MKKILKEYFSFNKTERRGIFVLLLIIVILILFNSLLPYFISSKKNNFSAFTREVEAFEKSRVILEKSKKEKFTFKEFDFKDPDRSVARSRLNPFAFDPNIMTVDEWKDLGLTDKQITSIMNYRSKGGTFRCKADFKKMYCIREDEYEVLEPYIKLPETPPPQEYKNSFQPKQKEEFTLELNTATTEDLDRIRGIGKYFAEKIIAYRRKLGGFCRMEQLLEVPKMDTARYEQIKAFITINPAALTKMDVNTASFDELSKHPYIGYNVALSLTNYRMKHGKFSQLQDIKRSALITEEVYKRISPYLRAE